MAQQQRMPRIAAAVLRCVQPAVWVLWVAGIAAFLLLPLAAKRCYLDEKALLVGGALPTIRCAEGRQGLHGVGRQRRRHWRFCCLLAAQSPVDCPPGP